jgi:TonB family protein
VPLDEYKTQVLLLHSEQSTLDNLSSGFNDRYTVHCATSGSEALNTLVDTPINVIVTAHDLPGMSGLEALREAKKRSPDTIGILLAGSKTSDIQALVGDEEVFQVVSGTVTGDGLSRLVDNATRQMRLMALAKSANDTTAGVDEPAEHIIMETSANGSTIISDGTGRMPVLDPKKVSAAASVGSRAVDVLVLTKDQEFLETIKDSSRGMHKVYYANTLGQANEAIRKYKIGVAVVDAAMVGEKIEQLTQHLRKGSARLVSIVAGRRDDGDMLMDLINRGKVYRFLLKPVSPGRARLAVESSVKHHLEAPDAAFINKGAAAAPAKPAMAKPAPPAPKPAPAKAAPKPAARPAAKPTPVETAPSTPVDPPLGSVTSPDGHSPIEDGLANAFGQDDSSFTETVTGLISTVTKKFSSDKQDSPAPEVSAAASEPAVVESILDLSSDINGSGGSGSDGSVFGSPKFIGIAAAAVVVIAAALFWFMSGSDTPVTIDQDSATPSFADSDVVLDEAPLEIETVDAGDLLAEARLARDAGQIFNPAGSSAIELFAAALAADPNNAEAASEFEAIVGQALGMAESALLESKLDDADAALQRVAAVNADNARLPFLTAQLAQMQLRGRLDDARVALREERFEDAATALSAARNLGVEDTSEIDAIAGELANARNEQQADDVLAKAADRLASGDLLSPANDNARYYYELVLSNDSANAAARQGLSAIAGKLAFQASAQIDSGNLSAAEDTLADARSLDPANSEVEATVTALANARAAVVAQQRRDEAARQAAAERAAAEEQAAIAQAAAESEAEAAAEVEAARLATEQQDAGALVGAAIAQTVADPEASDVGTQIETSAADTTTDEASAELPDQVPEQVPAPAQSTSPALTAISSLNRIKYVAPKYPRSAERRNLSGWVDVVFTVGTDGVVSDVEVRNSEPGDVFVNVAIKAVEKWQFEPVIEDGYLVAKRAGVRLMFALE